MLVGLMVCALPMTSPRQTVVTDHGLGPDKRATAWLMAQRAVPGAELAGRRNTYRFKVFSFHFAA